MSHVSSFNTHPATARVKRALKILRRMDKLCAGRKDAMGNMSSSSGLKSQTLFIIVSLVINVNYNY